MKRTLFLVVAILCFGAASRAAGTPAALPAAFGRWNASGAPSVTSPAALDQLLGSNATGFREYIVKSIEQRNYAQGTQTAAITMYRLRDPSSAYGAYTFLRDNSMSVVELGAYASASQARALMVVGEMLVDVTVPAKQARPSDADLKELADLLNKQADQTPYPTIGEHLPEKDRVKDSEHYFLGPRSLAQFVPLGTDDWVGFDHSAETIVARYKIAGKEETLLVASYPTQQIAAMKFSGMLRRFTFDPPGAVPAGQTVLFGKRVSSIVAVVVGAESRDSANKILDQVGYESAVTWDEPKSSYTEPGIGPMIVGAFMGTGAIMVLAIAAGIGFGGIRVVIKIFLPNKVFDRDKQIEILQLGISSKPIKAKDFY
ncbi:MAG: hypothetical protein LAO19_01105 [Acidobacteriia bacterium]|nr:hypothetical protein [Terriglobia bacterium]